MPHFFPFLKIVFLYENQKLNVEVQDVCPSENSTLEHELYENKGPGS